VSNGELTIKAVPPCYRHNPSRFVGDVGDGGDCS